MNELHTAALAIFSVLGIACLGIGGITLFAGGMSDSPSASEKADREGCGFGVAGLVLLALAAGMNWL
jgi:hypothetical protein